MPHDYAIPAVPTPTQRRSLNSLKHGLTARKFVFSAEESEAYQANFTAIRSVEIMGEMKEFAGVYYREGALDPKTMQLVALAAMAAAGCTS